MTCLEVQRSHDAITDKAFEQDWALDATGNWDDRGRDGPYGPPPAQIRT